MLSLILHAFAAFIYLFVRNVGRRPPHFDSPSGTREEANATVRSRPAPARWSQWAE
ncbi:hypothetical protein ACFTZB_19395 [Rhodococcus sp. NPDC057014]|uniref:hypothetical protein n=1 Tax=Rhodococcus sp. NPDC057014 TaxID=3346000 RepID=UPI003630B5AF